MEIYQYDRRRAYRYALRWAWRRNPLFYDFTGSGGNCTNFVSQCVFAGCCTMNFTQTFGWYYLSDEDRAPAWTGVEFFYNFITTNDGVGPYGREVGIEQLQIGDAVQLRREDGDYYHTLLVSGRDGGEVLLAGQSNDVFNRPLSTYDYFGVRGIKIDGFRADGERCNCFDGLISGDRLISCE